VNCGNDGSLCYSFEALGDDYPYLNDYPFQNAPIDEKLYHQFPLRECTSYLEWRMNANAGTTNPNYPFFFNTMGGGTWGHADNWDVNAKNLGYTVDSTAQAGAIAQWATNPCCLPYGHVAYVEQVNSDNSIVVSEYNYGLDDSKVKYQFGLRTIKPTDKAYPDYFIHVVYLTVSTDSLNFGNQVNGSRTPLQVLITNPWNAPVPVNGISISPAGSEFSIDKKNSTCKKGGSIPAEGNCQVTVVFNPTETGQSSAVLTVADTAGPLIHQVITLSGSGTQ
jgi:surface antigen